MGHDPLSTYLVYTISTTIHYPKPILLFSILIKIEESFQEEYKCNGLLRREYNFHFPNSYHCVFHTKVKIKRRILTCVFKIAYK